MAVSNIFEAYVAGGTPKVDREAGVIRGVKLLGRTSANDREYSDRALQQAAKAYDGLGVNTNHPDRKTPGVERPVQDGFGWLESVEVKTDGVYGDLHYIKAHPMAEVICEAAERRPDRFGMSHNASGETARKGGKTIVESITNVRSVDVVQRPATTNGLFESRGNMPQTRTLKELIESLPQDKYRKALQDLLEDDAFPMANPDMPVDMTPVADDAAPSSDQAAKDAFKSLIDAILDDDSITWAETQAKIKEAVAALAKMSGGDPVTETPIPAEGAAEEEPAMESLKEQVTALEKKLKDKEVDEHVRGLLESKKLAVTPVRVMTLKAVTDKTAQSTLMEGWSKEDAPKAKERPRTSPGISLIESLESDENIPATAEDMIKKYR